MEDGERKVPKHLKHKPIYYINGYHEIDGQYKQKTQTKTVGLSLGKAQWSEEFVPSVKVWRYGKDKWSRQSEETTITRALDMATLILKVYDHLQNGAPLGTFDGPNVYGDKIEIELTDRHDLKEQLKNYCNEHHADIDCHIKMLKETLDNMKL